MIGKLYPSHNEALKDKDGVSRSPMWLASDIGTAEDTEGNQYHLSSTIPSGSMLVRSAKTGRSFLIEWAEVIQLAIERGINSTDPIPNIKVEVKSE